jgi:hypothetical protein
MLDPIVTQMQSELSGSGFSCESIELSGLVAAALVEVVAVVGLV